MISAKDFKNAFNSTILNDKISYASNFDIHILVNYTFIALKKRIDMEALKLLSQQILLNWLHHSTSCTCQRTILSTNSVGWRRHYSICHCGSLWLWRVYRLLLNSLEWIGLLLFSLLKKWSSYINWWSPHCLWPQNI